ncbi:MAG: hypothetical protein ACRDRN_24145, partial [Sciscionella sp.]
EIVARLRLAGGVDALVARARELAEHDLPLPGHLAAWAFLADRDDGASRQCYVEVFERRAAADPSLMAQVNFLVSRAWVERARTVATE